MPRANPELVETAQVWVNRTDRERVEVALHFSEAFLFHRRADMARRFEEITRRWPDLKGRCDEILAEWDEWIEREEIPVLLKKDIFP